MARSFAPKVKQRTYKGQPVWVVDCRSWATVMRRLGYPAQKRFEHPDLAQAYLQQIIVAQRTGRPAAPELVEVRRLCDLYLQSKKRSEAAASTLVSLRSSMRGFLGFLDGRGIRDVRDVNPAVVDQWREQMFTRFAVNTVRNRLQHVRQMFRWANRLGYVEGDPTNAVAMPRAGKRRRCLTDEEVRILLEGARPDQLTIWRFMLMTGLRKGEMAGLQVGDVHLDVPAQFVSVIGKGNKPRDVDLVALTAIADARNLLERAIATGSEPLLPFGYSTLGVRFQQERDRLGLSKEVTLHALRHTCATWLANRTGMPLTEVRDVLGHHSINVTEVYVHADRARRRQGLGRLEDQLFEHEVGINLESPSLNKQANSPG